MAWQAAVVTTISLIVTFVFCCLDCRGATRKNTKIITIQYRRHVSAPFNMNLMTSIRLRILIHIIIIRHLIIPIKYAAIQLNHILRVNLNCLVFMRCYRLPISSSAALLPLNQPLNPRGAYIQFTLAHLQCNHSITEGFPCEWCLFALLKQYRWRVHVDQLRGWRGCWSLCAGYA